MPEYSAIVGFGSYLPVFRITTEEIAKHWQQEAGQFEKGLGVKEKTVAGKEEDAFTMAFEAGKQAIDFFKIESSRISAVFTGSESHPYAVKPTSGMLAAALECHPFCHSADLEFACKAGTAAMQIIDSMVRSGQVDYGLAVGTDKAQSKPGDALEYTAAAGATAFVLGPAKDKKAICRIERTISFTTDTPDFWRPQGAKHPEHAGRFTGEPGYFHHVRSTIKGLFEITKIKASDPDHVVLHMPNAKFPATIARELGFTTEQMKEGFIVPYIGNTYSACSPLGLTRVLQKAKKNQRILLCSYGSGAGCDAFLLTMLKDGKPLPVDERPLKYLSYAAYRSLSL